jgi:hypothetical protein
MLEEMNIRLAYLYILLVFFLVGSYLFCKGEKFGVEKYKHSVHMELALKSAYHFGYVDAKAGRPEDWDNGGDE